VAPINPLNLAQLLGAPSFFSPVSRIAKFFPNRSHSLFSKRSLRFIAPGLLLSPFLLLRPRASSSSAGRVVSSGNASAKESSVETSFLEGRRREVLLLLLPLATAAFFSIRETNLAWRAWRAAFLRSRGAETVVAAAAVLEARAVLVRMLARPWRG
jgi:hypothetical protein